MPGSPPNSGSEESIATHASGPEHHLFVSYAHADDTDERVSRLVDHLREKLAKAGLPGVVDIFYDQQSLRAGDDWESRIRGHLIRSRSFVAILSPHYFASDWCRREWAAWRRNEMHRHCLRDGAQPVYYHTIDGFWEPKNVAILKKSPREIAEWIAIQKLRTGAVGVDVDQIERSIAPWFQRQLCHDFRPFDAAALASLASDALRERLSLLANLVTERLDRADRAQRSPSDLDAYNPAFTGRIDDLIALRQGLAQGATGITTVVHGLGGIGKTELALAYAHAYGHEYPGGRYQLPCAGITNWRGALDRFADRHGWTFEDEIKFKPDLHFTLLLNKLHEFSERHGRCLLLCDNVDSADLLRSGKIAQLRLRDDHFHLLFTTRLPQPPNAGDTAILHWRALDSLPQEDAFALLQTIVHACPEPEHSSLDALARELGGFTIAVELTGRYLANNPNDPPSSLLARLRAAILPELGDKAERTGRDLFRHGEEARLDFILGQTLATLLPHEVRTLEYASQLAPDAVPLDWLRQLLGEDFPEFAKHSGSTSDTKWRSLVEKLSSARLLMRRKKPIEPGQSQSNEEVDVCDDAALASIHRLVQEVVRSRYGPATDGMRQALSKIVKANSELLEKQWHKKENRWLFIVVENLADAWLTRVERGESELIKDADDVANDAYLALDHLAAWTRAEPLLRRNKALLESQFGCEGKELPSTLSNLGDLLSATDRLEEAEPLYRLAIAIDEKTHGPKHPAVATDLNNLAMLLKETNRLEEAESLMRRALAIDENAHGPDHPEVATDLNNLALLFSETDRMAEAEPLYRRALDIWERNLGPDHPDVAIALTNLADLLAATNRQAEAEPLYRRALAIDEEGYGSNHPQVAAGLFNLADFGRNNNNLAEAEPLYRQALAMDENSYGPDHPEVAGDLNNLALLLFETNQNEAAEPLFRRALAIYEKSYGLDHPEVSKSLNNLALLLKETNRMEEAEPLYRRALAIDEKFYGPDRPQLSVTLLNLGELLLATNRMAEAEPLLLKALAIDEKSLGPVHPDVATCLDSLAELFRATNRLAEAEPLFRRALAIREKALGSESRYVAESLIDLATLLQASKQLVEAVPLLHRGLVILAKFSVKTGHEHARLAVTKRNYHELLVDSGMTEEQAVDRVRSALEEGGFPAP